MQFGACIVLLAALLQTTWAAGCKYGRGDGFVKGQCDPVTSMRTFTMVLKRGDPATCAPTKDITKPCGNDDGCKYRKSRDEAVSACDPQTKERTLTLTRTQGDAETCPETKTITKPCVPEGCVYTDGEWSECAEGDKRSTRVDTLVSSPEGVNCDATVERTRSCRAVAQKEARKESRKEGKNENKKAKKEKKKQERQEKKEKKKNKRKERKNRRSEAEDQS